MPSINFSWIHCQHAAFLASQIRYLTKTCFLCQAPLSAHAHSVPYPWTISSCWSSSGTAPEEKMQEEMPCCPVTTRGGQRRTWVRASFKPQVQPKHCSRTSRQALLSDSISGASGTLFLFQPRGRSAWGCWGVGTASFLHELRPALWQFLPQDLEELNLNLFCPKLQKSLN